jgi:hypothetical protein
MIQVQLPVILRIFEENQNPVGGDSQTNHVSISGRTNGWTGGKLICPPTLRRGLTIFEEALK